MNAPDESRDRNGLLQLKLTDDDDPTYLRWTGDLLERETDATALDRFTAPDQKFWDYRISRMPLTLHWVLGSGLSIVAGDTEAPTEKQVRMLAKGVIPRLVAFAEGRTTDSPTE